MFTRYCLSKPCSKISRYMSFDSGVVVGTNLWSARWRLGYVPFQGRGPGSIPGWGIPPLLATTRASSQLLRTYAYEDDVFEQKPHALVNLPRGNSYQGTERADHTEHLRLWTSILTEEGVMWLGGNSRAALAPVTPRVARRVEHTVAATEWPSRNETNNTMLNRPITSNFFLFFLFFSFTTSLIFHSLFILKLVLSTHLPPTNIHHCNQHNTFLSFLTCSAYFSH